MESGAMFGEYQQFFKAVAALVLVLGLMGGLTLALKKLGLGGPMPVVGKDKRLKIIEVLAVDGRRKVMILQRDDVQHLILLGGNEETVIETGFNDLDNKDHA